MMTSRISPDQYAFPYQADETDILSGGLTKRELFAAMAMQGFCAQFDITDEAVAKMSVRQADALIAALNEEL